MDGVTPAGPADHRVQVGDPVEPATLEHWLAKGLVRHVARFGGREIRLDEVRMLDDGVEAVSLTVKTGSPQNPAFDILPSEAVAVLFQGQASPLIIPLRTDFPATPHTFGLPIGAPISASKALCIDDRPWNDACADYNGAELIRRISGWFRRASAGQMDDEMQFRDPAFLPPPETIVMSSALERAMEAEEGPPILLALTETEENAKVWLAREYDAAPPPSSEGKVWRPFVGITVGFQVENHGAMWHQPRHLGHLHSALSNVDFDLLEHLRDHVRRFLGDTQNTDRVHGSHLLIRILVHDVIAQRIESYCLLAHHTIGAIGDAMGLLWPSLEVAEAAYTPRIPAGEIDVDQLAAMPLTPANFSRSFDRESAQHWVGRNAAWGRAVSFGAGAIGCKVLDSLVREGAFSELDIVDEDRLLPHNLARHVLRERQIGALKAKELALELHQIRPDLKATPHIEMLRDNGMSEELSAAITSSDFMLDLTASVGASRTLSDIDERGRAVSAFYNPSGDAVVVMVEDAARREDLATLEATYYGGIVLRPELGEHLKAPNQAVVSSGQCRSVSSRISSSDAALLAAAASRAIERALREEGSHLSISSLCEDGSLEVTSMPPSEEMQEGRSQGWRIRCSGTVRKQLEALREKALPNETGGVLLGIVDHQRQRIEVSLGLPAPRDSRGSPWEFERGVHDLAEVVEAARAKVMHQLTYIGEWHTHPEGASADPSPIDRKQLDELAADLASEERPGIMAIVGSSDIRLFAEEPDH